jgi:heme oxygenase
MVTAASTVETALEAWRLTAPLELWQHPGLAARGTIDLLQIGELGCIAVPASVLDIGSTPAYAGALYVLEGSALGGHFIAAQWARNGHSDRPHSYFALPGTTPHPRWQAFCSWLDQVVTPEDIPLATDAATRTFLAFYTALR